MVSSENIKKNSGESFFQVKLQLTRKKHFTITKFTSKKHSQCKSSFSTDKRSLTMQDFNT